MGERRAARRPRSGGRRQAAQRLTRRTPGRTRRGHPPDPHPRRHRTPGRPVMPQSIVVMGVSGAGKSSVGQALATQLGAQFIDGDTLHPEANVRKMASGVPLTDEDRWPWLHLVGTKLSASTEKPTIV